MISYTYNQLSSIFQFASRQKKLSKIQILEEFANAHGLEWQQFQNYNDEKYLHIDLDTNMIKQVATSLTKSHKATGKLTEDKCWSIFRKLYGNEKAIIEAYLQSIEAPHYYIDGEIVVLYSLEEHVTVNSLEEAKKLRVEDLVYAWSDEKPSLGPCEISLETYESDQTKIERYNFKDFVEYDEFELEWFTYKDRANKVKTKFKYYVDRYNLSEVAEKQNIKQKMFFDFEKDYQKFFENELITKGKDELEELFDSYTSE